ncbi:MAG: hypothetical protein COX89_00400 [Candidatus Nealsonbacteria bacterium CG_4_10_14_0_2_um_filter_37_10]|uniref:DUF4242 domain-containing protein n=3 Tax=Candidatus Nealsoniibacteriota TaxID=1817911 RepID=A0A2H0TIU3_9BACT|nr:MAG: hypothetical protein COU43_02435 [Candidatus Nealsonbacteria bacterium CG10_big_fil_rev_8_21_14_0_10_37_25]PIZ89644.1 MAG: hypothetical protein COX89_00400 [Candidatus Nealsonbacteria bacterium CG_4_10_14_0_2_um_filter_37_10]PJA84223.1 MAG: hypothetical protein CO145_01730 [Candidatus Nealsonbacteria bacterium CG_4_9_14_3_um_filter_37_13]
MAKILVFHYTEEGRVPKLSEQELKDLRAKFDEVLKGYPGVHFSTYVDDNGMGVCIWEAPNIEVVKEIEEKVIGAPPADPVIVVKQIL